MDNLYDNGYRLFDLHTHTRVSVCSLNKLSLDKRILDKKQKKGMPLTIAVTNHNKLTKTDFAIPGEEIKTPDGEIIALFIQEEITPWQSSIETVEQIKEQGGVSIVAHPYDGFRPDAMQKLPSELLKKVDMIEVANGRSLSNFISRAKKSFLRWEKKGLFPSAGSDAHFPWELGDAGLFLKLDDKDDPKKFKRAVKRSWKLNRWDMVKENKTEFLKITNMLGSAIVTRSRRLYNYFSKRK